MYPDHLQIWLWLEYSHCFLIWLILALFRFRETGQIRVFLESYRCVSWWTVLLFVIHDDFMPGIMFSGCPSVRPSKDRNTLFQTVHGPFGPSDQPLPFAVRLERYFWTSPGERMKRMTWNFACLCIPTICRSGWIWSWFVYFANFGTILTLRNGSNSGLPGISRRRHGGNGLKLCMLMYPDHFQNWLDYSHGLLIYPFWHHFYLVKLVILGVSGQCFENDWE